MKKNRSYAYIVAVLVLSWIVQYVLFSGMLPEKYLSLYMFVPAALAFVFFLFGNDPWKRQAALFTRRTSLWSWIFALIYPLIWFGIIIAIALAAGLGKFNADALAVVASWPFLTSFITMVLIMAPVVFGEEYGWRGYLLPELDKKHGRVWATVITGLVWGLWHIPSYYITYSQAGLGNPILLTAIAVIFVTVGAFPYTYLFYLNGNLLPCVLFHAVYDKAAGVAFFSTSGSTGPGQGAPGLLTIHWPYVLGLVIVTGSVLAVFLAREFVKSNFGSPERFQ